MAYLRPGYSKKNMFLTFSDASTIAKVNANASYFNFKLLGRPEATLNCTNVKFLEPAPNSTSRCVIIGKS